MACVDEVDRQIVRLVYEAGSPGLLPKDLQLRFERFRVTHHQIRRRILRVNKRLEKEVGERKAEKRSWLWALTSFTTEFCGDIEN